MAHQHIVYMMMADAAARRHDMAGLQAYAPKLEELALRDDHQPYLAVAHRAFGVGYQLAAEPAQAIARLNQAMGIFAKLEAGWQIGRTFFEMGEVARGMAETERAREFYQRALAAFESLRALPDFERTRAALHSLN